MGASAGEFPIVPPQFMNSFNQGLSGVGNAYNNLINAQLNKAQLPYASDLAKADVAYKIAMSQYLSNPNQSLKYMTDLGKTYIEPNIIRAQQQKFGINPDQNNIQSSNDISNINNSYELKRQKDISDSQTRNRNLFASNIEKTISFINPDDLTKYSGVQGQLKKHLAAARSGLGYEDKDYNKYLEAKQGVDFLAKQIRQFYGDSVQPSVQKALSELADPTSWDRSPEEARKIFDKNINILKNETSTYREALQSPSAYREQKNSSNNSNVEGKIQQVKTINGTQYFMVNGQWMYK